MSATANQLDGVDLRNVNLGGMIKEEVLDRIIDASPTDTPFLTRIGSGTTGNDEYTWPIERLEDPVIDQQRVDGSGGRNDESKVGARIKNVSEIRTKTIEVSTRANAVNTIGFARALVRQLNRRGMALMRDVNATFLSNNAAVVSSATAPVTAGLFAWPAGRVLDAIDQDSAATPTTSAFGSSSSALVWDANAGNEITTATGWTTNIATTTLVPERAIGATNGNLTEEAIRALANGVWELGNMPTVLHARPAVITRLSQYMFTSSARIATLIADGGDSGPRKAVGATNEFLTDFGVTLSFVPDRQMTLAEDAGADTCSAVFIYDPSVIETAVLMSKRTKPLPADGLFERSEIQWDLGLRVLDPHGVAVVTQVDETAAVTAT